METQNGVPVAEIVSDQLTLQLQKRIQPKWLGRIHRDIKKKRWVEKAKKTAICFGWWGFVVPFATLIPPALDILRDTNVDGMKGIAWRALVGIAVIFVALVLKRILFTLFKVSEIMCEIFANRMVINAGILVFCLLCLYIRPFGVNGVYGLKKGKDSPVTAFNTSSWFRPYQGWRLIAYTEILFVAERTFDFTDVAENQMRTVWQYSASLIFGGSYPQAQAIEIFNDIESTQDLRNKVWGILEKIVTDHNVKEFTRLTTEPRPEIDNVVTNAAKQSLLRWGYTIVGSTGILAKCTRTELVKEAVKKDST